MGLRLGQFGSTETSHETDHGDFVGKLHLVSHGSVERERTKANDNQTQKDSEDKWVLADFWFSMEGVNSHSGENHGRQGIVEFGDKRADGIVRFTKDMVRIWRAPESCCFVRVFVD